MAGGVVDDVRALGVEEHDEPRLDRGEESRERLRLELSHGRRSRAVGPGHTVGAHHVPKFRLRSTPRAASAIVGKFVADVVDVGIVDSLRAFEELGCFNGDAHGEIRKGVELRPVSLGDECPEFLYQSGADHDQRPLEGHPGGCCGDEWAKKAELLPL